MPLVHIGVLVKLGLSWVVTVAVILSIGCQETEWLDFLLWYVGCELAFLKVGFLLTRLWKGLGWHCGALLVNDTWLALADAASITTGSWLKQGSYVLAHTSNVILLWLLCLLDGRSVLERSFLNCVISVRVMRRVVAMSRRAQQIFILVFFFLNLVNPVSFQVRGHTGATRFRHFHLDWR